MEVLMAQQVNVKFVDDLDGSDAAGTVSFGLDGRTYDEFPLAFHRVLAASSA